MTRKTLWQAGGIAFFLLGLGGVLSWLWSPGCDSYALHRRRITGLSLSPDGTILASASYDKSVCLWDTQHHRVLKRITSYSTVVTSVAFTPDGSMLATASDADEIDEDDGA